MSKGSKRRPTTVPDSTLEKNWLRAFGKKKPRPRQTKPADPMRPAAVHQF